MATDTTNYLLKKPTVGGDDDLWGGYINDNMDTIDTQMKSNDDAAAAAQSTADTANTTANAALPKAGGTMTGDIAHGDNVKAKFGASDDLQIYHDGSNSYVQDLGSGSLYLKTNGSNVNITSDAGNMALFARNGAVNLYHNNSNKFATTSTGVDVTGTVTADGVNSSIASGLYPMTAENTATTGTTTGAGINFKVHDGVSVSQVGGVFSTANSWSYGTYSKKQLNVTNDASGGIRVASGGSGPVTFHTDSGASGTAPERARIDSSGNHIWGKTSTSFSTEGAYIAQNGKLVATRANGSLQALNRTGSDGPISEFYKDGATVGSVSVENSNINIGSGDTGVRFDSANNALIPVNMSTNAVQDNTTDLGAINYRWKDAFLSGGIHLGGTGAANKLSDYEEGTWTPAFTAGTGITYGSRWGRYTKIGNTVFFDFELTWSAGTGITQRVTLPLSVANLAGNYPMSAAYNNAGITYPAGRTTLVCYPAKNSSYVQLDSVGSAIAAAAPTLSSSGALYVSGHYQTA